MPAALMPTVALTVAGCLLMLARAHPGKWKWVRKVAPPIYARLGGLAYLGAGVGVAALGLPRLIAWLAGLLDQFCAEQGWMEVGKPLVFVAAAFAIGFYVAGMLPDGLSTFDAPDVVLGLGLVIPSLVLGVPGGIGSFLQELIYAVGDAVAGMARDAVQEG